MLLYKTVNFKFRVIYRAQVTCHWQMLMPNCIHMQFILSMPNIRFCIPMTKHRNIYKFCFVGHSFYHLKTVRSFLYSRSTDHLFEIKLHISLLHVLTLPTTTELPSKGIEVKEFVHTADEYGCFSLTRKSLSLVFHFLATSIPK